LKECSSTGLVTFSLPASNAKVERVFSTANIKTEKRTVLTNSSLNDLFEISCDAVSVTDYNPERAIQLWWDDKIEYPNQKPQAWDHEAYDAQRNQMMNWMMIIASLTGLRNGIT